MRKTKIVCTIGPACDNEETLEKMCLAGMNVARLNFSHGTHPEQQAKMDRVKRVREKLGLPIAIMLDTKGPEYRIRTFENGSITLHEGDQFSFTTEQIVGDEHRVSVSYAGLIHDLSVGDRVLLPELLQAALRAVGRHGGQVWAVLEADADAEELLPIYLEAGLALRAIRPLNGLAPCWLFVQVPRACRADPVWVPLSDRPRLAALLGRGWSAVDSETTAQGTALALSLV